MIEFSNEEIQFILEELESLWDEYGIGQINEARAVINKIARAFPDFSNQVQKLQKYLD